MNGSPAKSAAANPPLAHPPLARPPRARGRPRWSGGQVALVLGAAIGLAGGFSGLYFATLAIFLKPEAAAFHWSRAEASAIPSFAMAGFAIGSPLIGRLVDAFGARRLILICAVAFPTVIVLFSRLPGSYALFVAMSFVIGLVGAGVGPGGYMATLPRSFDRQLGMAVSFSQMGAGVGGTIMPLLGQRLVMATGWRTAYVGLAAIALVMGFMAVLLISVHQRNVGRTRSPTAPRGEGSGPSLAQALRDRRFWILFAVVFVATAGGLGATVHVAALLTDHGMTPIRAAGVAALSGVGLLLGRFGGGLIMDLIFAPAVAAGGFALGAIGLAILGLEPAGPYPLLALGAVLFGFALGAEGDFAAFAVRRYFGQRAFGAIYGAILIAYALGGVTGPILFGIGHDRLGGYEQVLLTAAAGYVLAGAAALTLGPYRWTQLATPDAAQAQISSKDQALAA